MRWGWLLSIALLGVMIPAMPAAAGTMHATLGLEYEERTFDGDTSRRAGWVSRLYLSWTSALVERERATLLMGHQWGVKRYWQAEEAAGSPGEVVANQLELEGTVRLFQRFAVRWGSEMKYKSVERISGEEGYLRTGLRLGVVGEWNAGLSGWANYGCGWDDARSPGQADLSLHELNGGIRWAHSRRLSGQLGVRGGRLAFDRQAWKVDPEGRLSPFGKNQQDDRIEWTIGAQYYRGLLLQVAYAWIDNSSNSMEYQYHAHRTQLTLARHLFGGVDGQLFLLWQGRRYAVEIPSWLPGVDADQEEYEQLLSAFSLARQLGDFCELRFQYRYQRNGIKSGNRLDDQKICSFSIDRVL